VNEELRAELIGRADRDQAARQSLPPGHGYADYERIVAPVDTANTAWLRAIVAEDGWPGETLHERRTALGLEPEQVNRARIMAAEGLPAGVPGMPRPPRPEATISFNARSRALGLARLAGWPAGSTRSVLPGWSCGAGGTRTGNRSPR
jgi:hypothetical protein